MGSVFHCAFHYDGTVERGGFRSSLALHERRINTAGDWLDDSNVRTVVMGQSLVL